MKRRQEQAEKLSKSWARRRFIKKSSLNIFPDEVESDGVAYILSEIGGRENKLESGENLGVYIPKDFDSCLKLGTLKLTSKQSKVLRKG